MNTVQIDINLDRAYPIDDGALIAMIRKFIEAVHPDVYDSDGLIHGPEDLRDSQYRDSHCIEIDCCCFVYGRGFVQFAEIRLMSRDRRVLIDLCGLIDHEFGNPWVPREYLEHRAAEEREFEEYQKYILETWF